MIVMIPLAEPNDPDPKIVSALIRRIEPAISELTHVADGIDRPGHIIDDQHRNVEAPKHSSPSKREIERHGDSEMREDVDACIFEQTAVPNSTYIGGVTFRALTKFGRLPNQPHHVGVGKAMHRTVNVFVGIGF